MQQKKGCPSTFGHPFSRFLEFEDIKNTFQIWEEQSKNR
jgi:hypothetical protein